MEIYSPFYLSVCFTFYIDKRVGHLLIFLFLRLAFCLRYSSRKGASIHMHIYWLILFKSITISGFIMLIEKNIFISGLKISIGYAGNIKGFTSGMNDISFWPLKHYATSNLGLALWCKCTNISFNSWPFMYNCVDLMLGKFGFGEYNIISRYLDIIRVKTIAIHCSCHISSSIRSLGSYYFSVTYFFFLLSRGTGKISALVYVIIIVIYLATGCF